MRIVVCGLIAGAALLGPVPMAMADTPANTAGAAKTANTDSRAVPQAEVSVLAVALTVGGTVAMAGSGVALARRRTVSRRPS
ncbi:MAG: hypothetical protein JO272_04615 [Pseudonocardiales bacterium]|nr:hypothetical protein [Pseudonocardiales bacterium]